MADGRRLKRGAGAVALASFIMANVSELDRAWAAFEAGDYAQAERLAFLLKSGREKHFLLGYIYAFTERFDEARRVFVALRNQAIEVGNLSAQHRALHQVGMVERMAGNWEAARLCFEEEIELIALLSENTLEISVNAYEMGLTSLYWVTTNKQR